jgi:ABC-type Fe3+ transport system permease subunit
MPQPPLRSHRADDFPARRGDSSGGTALGTWFVGLVTLIAVVWPLGAVLWTTTAGVMAGDVSKGPPAAGREPALSAAPAWGLLGSTCLWALGIGLGSALLAWPAAWLIRGRGWGVIVRAAGTTLGSWLETLAQGPIPNAPSHAGKALAALGLMLWAWPIAALVLGSAVRRIDEHVLETLRMDASGYRKSREVWKLCRPGFYAAAAVVALVMLGSAIPLHLAQVPTYAVKVWFDLNLAPGSWRVWLSAWPLVAAALLGAWVLGGRILSAAVSPGENLPPPRSASAGRWLATGAIWGLSVLVPLMLFVRTVKGWKPYADFWTLSGEAVVSSSGVALATGTVGVLLAASFWQGVSSANRGQTPTLLLWCLRALLVMGLLPGVLVGSAVSIACNTTPGLWSLGDSAWILVIVHVARFGFVGALVGVWLAAIEPRAERDLRALDGALGIRGWMAASLPLQGGALIGTGLATAALSLHEIEAAVVVQPPGTPSLAQVMLNHLHQLRMQDVSAAAVSVVVVGLVIAAIAGWAGSRTLKQIG